MTVANLFQEATSTATIGTGSTLAGTQALTTMANKMAIDIITFANGDLETYTSIIAESTTNMATLDDLIMKLSPDFEALDLDYIKNLTADVQESMLKSQQSKRSRCKGKAMTMDNYTSMMTAAIAELLIRFATNKAKGTSGRAGTNSAYSEETLTKLAADQEALRKEIRNVQSKKSIAKSKAGFTEADEKWQILLVAEEQLKSIRVDGNSAPAKVVTVEVDVTKEKLFEMLAEVDPDNLKAKDLKEILASIKEMVSTTDDVEDAPAEEESATE